MDSLLPTPSTPAAVPLERDARLDALRGAAIGGILLVNVWTFAWGMGTLRYGVLPADAGWVDRAAVFLVSLLAEQKAYPLLAFLFGAGFALHGRALYRRLGSWDAARSAWRGRPRFLIRAGLMHGLLLWPGDILTQYGIVGRLIGSLQGARLARYRRAFLGCLAFTVVMGLATLLPGAADTARLQDALAAHQLLTAGPAGAFTLGRLKEFGLMLLLSAFMLPHVAGLFLLGAMAVRLGWLRQPQRHRLAWRRVRVIGLGVGLPANLLLAWISLQQALHAPQAAPFERLQGILLLFGAPLLAAGYLGTWMLAEGPRCARLMAWLAPVGRMALSNYLLQSLCGVLLLQTVGLGLGATLTHGATLAGALVFLVLQAGLSRVWLAHHAQGPLEQLYRRFS